MNARIVWIALLPLLVAACSHPRRTISGEATSESGTPVAGVHVEACYIRWEWSLDGLYYQNHCSPPVLTDRNGKYVIHFAGPRHMRLFAGKTGWMQMADSVVPDTHITLIADKERQLRRRVYRKASARAFRQRRPGESAAGYYCRVVMHRSSSLSVDYKDTRVQVITTLLLDEPHAEALFALHGPGRSVQAFSRDFVLQTRGRDENLSRDSARTVSPASCGDDLYLVRVRLPLQKTASRSTLEMRVASIAAMWDMHVSKLPRHTLHSRPPSARSPGSLDPRTETLAPLGARRTTSRRRSRMHGGR